MSNSPSVPLSNRWLPRFAWLTVGATIFLICSGGMVTSKGVGLAVPDWPTTFGYNMFAFPFSKWVGGIFFEHVHRLIASTIGVLTIILAVWLGRTDERRWVRNLGYAALGAVVLQGILGGLRVTLLKDEIGIFHALLAQAFLGMLVLLALATSRIWNSLAFADNALRIRRIAIFTTAVIYLQLALGATMRHQHRDLAILDFPLAYGKILPDTSPDRLAKINTWRDARALSDVSAAQIWLQMAHRFCAVVILAGATASWLAARHHPTLRKISELWLFCLLTQIALGAWTIWSNKAADIATAHVAVGAITFGVGITLVALSSCARKIPVVRSSREFVREAVSVS